MKLLLRSMYQLYHASCINCLHKNQFIKTGITFLAAVLYAGLLTAQQTDTIVISGRFRDTALTRAVLYRFDSGEVETGSAPIKQGQFRMALPASLPPGLYRLRYYGANPAQALDLILAGEPQVSFELDPANREHPLLFTASAQNKTWYNYRFALQQQLDKISLLTEFINRYPAEKDRAVLAARQSLEQEKAAATSAFQQFTRQQGNNWAGRLVKNQPLWFPDPRESPQVREENYHRQYWKGINTADTTLLNSPLYTDHIYNYLGYYLNPDRGWTEAEQVKGFKEAIDTVMQQFSASPRLRKFALQYMTKGFQQIGQETVLQYLDQQYGRQEQCTSDQAGAALQKRLAAYEAMKPGAPAPDISYASTEKTMAGLRDIKADTVIVAFWASWCPHCSETMPKVNAAVAGRPGVQVLAVSLDEDPQAYMEATGKLNNMLHLCDYRKWNSQPVADYHITATPTFFMLDRERRIIGKYSSLEGLAQQLGVDNASLAASPSR